MESLDYPLGDIDFADAPLEDLYEQLHVLRGQGRQVAPVRFHGGTAYAIIGNEALNQAFLDDERLPSAAAYERQTLAVHGRSIQNMRGAEHRINRTLVQQPFIPKLVREHVTSLLEPLADRLIDELPAQGPVDLVPRFTRRYPFLVISTLLGIPVQDEAWLHERLFMLFRYPWEPEAAVAAKGEIDDYLIPIIKARRESPGGDILSALGKAAVEGIRLTDEEILSFVRLLYPAGAETTFNAMGSMMTRVLSDPAVYQLLRDDPARRPDAVEEALRMDAPVPFLPRYAEQAVTLGGVDIPKDSWLLYGIAGANRDPAAFADSDTFRMDRGMPRHITFGRGVHVCIGLHLARAEMLTGLSRLLDRLQGLRLAAPVRAVGGILRGPAALEVIYDSIRPA